ncbi:MAG: alpha/beta hydrolase [Nonlabens sp.]
MHGNSSSSKIFKELELNYKQVTLSFYGHDGNEMSKDYSIHSHINQVYETTNQIDGPVFLIGNSYGGHIAIEVAPKIDRLAGMMIMGCPPLKIPLNFEEAFHPVPELTTFLTKAPAQTNIEIACSTTVLDKSLSKKLVGNFKKTNPEVREILSKEFMSGKWTNQYRIFRQLDCKKYIVAGDVDSSINYEYLQSIADLDQDMTFLIDIKNCGHYTTYEAPTLLSLIINNAVAEALVNK